MLHDSATLYKFTIDIDIDIDATVASKFKKNNKLLSVTLAALCHLPIFVRAAH